MRVVLAAADPAAQLVQLGDAVALRPLDHHHGRVGDVDADLDHASSPRARRSRRRRRPRIASAFAADGIWPCRTPTSKSRSSPAAQPLRLLLRRLPLQLLRLVDQRADDVGLAALAQPLAHELVGAGTALLVDQPGLDRLAARGQLVQRRRVEVAVGGQGERAGDRRRGHVQDVRAPSPALPSRRERGAARPRSGAARRRRRRPRRANSTAGLDQRVGADDQSQLAAGEPARGLACGRGAGVAPVSSAKGIASSASRRSERRPRAARPGSRSAPSAPPGSPASSARSIE